MSAKTGAGIAELKERMIRMVPEGFGGRTITGDLVSEGRLSSLVMPPGHPGTQRSPDPPRYRRCGNCWIKKCIVLSTTTDKLVEALDQLKNPQN